MLIWLQNILTKRRILFAQILAVSIFAHLVVLLLSMLRTSIPLSFSMYKNVNTNVPVLFDPFKRSVFKEHVAPVRQQSKKNKKQMQQDKKKVITQKNSSSGVKKSKQQAAQSMEKQKQKEKKVSSSIVKPKEQVIAEPKEENLVAENPEQIEKIEQTVLLTPEQEQLILGRNDVEMFKVYIELQGQINENWLPPIGFSDLVAELKLAINADGVLTQVLVEKSSGILAFDSSAKKVCKKLMWPVLCWGREIIITFRQ